MIFKIENEINVSIVGGFHTGKTNFFNLIFSDSFKDYAKTTLEIVGRRKKININKQQYTLNINDTPGYNNLNYKKELAIKYSDIVIFIYNTNLFKTFNDIKDLYRSINYIEEKYIGFINAYRSYLGNWENKFRYFAIIGNKFDKNYYNLKEEIEVKNFSNSIGAIFKILTLKEDNSFNINQLLEKLLLDFIKKKKFFLKRKEILNII